MGGRALRVARRDAGWGAGRHSPALDGGAIRIGRHVIRTRTRRGARRQLAAARGSSSEAVGGRAAACFAICARRTAVGPRTRVGIAPFASDALLRAADGPLRGARLMGSVQHAHPSTSKRVRAARVHRDQTHSTRKQKECVETTDPHRVGTTRCVSLSDLLPFLLVKPRFSSARPERLLSIPSYPDAPCGTTCRACLQAWSTPPCSPAPDERTTAQG